MNKAWFIVYCPAFNKGYVSVYNTEAKIKTLVSALMNCGFSATYIEV